MGTINATIRTRGIKGNIYPIVIRIIHKRVTAEVKVENFYIQENQWDAANQRVHPNRHRRAAVINNSIKLAMRPIEDAHDSLVLSGRHFTVKDILELSNRNPDYRSGSFTQYLKDYISTNPDELSFGTLKVYKSAIYHWQAFAPEVNISDINETHIIGFRKHLIDAGVNLNTNYNRMKTIRKMVRRAVKAGLLEKNPFAHVSLKQVKGSRAFLTKEELDAVIAFETTNTISQLARDVFIFSSHTGLRFSDFCRLSRENLEVSGNTRRLTLRMGKTSEIISFNLSQLANSIVEKYLTEGEEYIFPMLRGQIGHRVIENVIGSQNAMLNAYLKEVIQECGITKNISMHCGRHTFAVNSLTMGGDIYVLSKFLGHQSLSTTEIYAKAVDKRKDELTELWN